MNAMDQNDLLQAICQLIFDKKGFNILTLDVRGVSTMTDYFIIAEGNVDRHVQALSYAVVQLLKEHNIKPSHIDGGAVGDWIVLDCSDIVIHFFTPEMREKYTLEQVWKEGKVVSLPITV